MANKQMHHLKVGDNIFEIVDSVARSGISGAPTIVSLSSAMNDTSKLYLYIGSETGYTSGDWYYHNGTSWVSGGQYGDMQLDTSLTTSGMAADAKSVGDRFNSFATTATAGQAPIADGAGGWAWGDVESGDSVPTEVRQALFTLLSNAIYRDADLQDEKTIIQSWMTEVTSISVSPTAMQINGMSQQTIVASTQPTGGIVSWSSSDETIATVAGGVVTPTGVNGTCIITASCGGKSARCTVVVSGFATLLSISAVYTQSGTVYDTASLDSLRSDLVVTGTYSDSRTLPITEYTLSGTLEVGTSTITVAYGGKTTTFDVTVTRNPLVVGYRSIGTPTISGNIFTPSSEGFIMSSELFDPGEDSWAIRARLVTSSLASKFQNLIRTCDAEGNSKLSVLLQHKNAVSGYSWNLSSNGTSADINSATVTISDNTEMYIEVAFDGTQTYSVKTSTDGETWETVGTVTSSSYVYSGAYVGFGSVTSGTQPYAGSIYLDSLQFYIGGELRWKAVA